MERVKAKITATATVELVVILRKYSDGDIELDEVLEVLDIEDVEDIENVTEL